MKNIIKLVQGNSRPILVVSLTDETSELPIDLTGAEVFLKFSEVDSDTLKATLTGSLVDPVGGVCAFDWAEVPGVLSGDPGGYIGEVEIVFSDGGVHTVFDPLRFLLRESF